MSGPKPGPGRAAIVAKVIALVPDYVPRDDEDEWLRIYGDWDEGEE